MTILQILSRPFCKHKWACDEQICNGATMSWTGEPTRSFTFKSHCEKCGKKRVRSGMIVPVDKRFHPDCYAGDGWPIDPKTGERLKVAQP